MMATVNTTEQEALWYRSLILYQHLLVNILNS